MAAKHRLLILVGIVVIAVTVLVASGLPYFQLGLAMAQPYVSDDDGQSSDPVIICEGIDITNAVVGTINTTTPIYYEPVSTSQITPLTISAGQSFWVLGHNTDVTYWKIVIACQTVWVPIDTVIPTAASPWFNAPLPGIVVS